MQLLSLVLASCAVPPSDPPAKPPVPTTATSSPAPPSVDDAPDDRCGDAVSTRFWPVGVPQDVIGQADRPDGGQVLTLSRPVHLGEDPVPAGNLVRQGADGTVERIDQVVSSYRNTVTLRGFAEGDELYAGTIYNNAVLHGGVTVPAPDDQILLLRRRPEGEIVWHTTLDASQMRLHDTATLPDGSQVVLLFSWTSPVFFGPRPDGIWRWGAVARFSADGNHLWTRSIGGPWQTVLDAITYDPIADALIVVGHARGQPYQPVVVGIDQPDALELDTGAVQAIVLALSTEGTPMWASALDGLAYTSAVAVLPDGDVAVGGYFSGPFGTLEAAAADQAWVARLSPGGEVRWQIQGNTDNGPSYTEALAPGPDDTVVWGGTAAGQPGFGQTGTGLALAGDTESTPFLVLVDADGHPRCAQRIAQGPHFWYYERQTMHDIASVRLRPDGRVSVVGDGRLPIVLDPDGGLRNEVPDEAGHEAAFEVVVELGVP